ncbi:histidine phosphatase family protein [uncultured Metabacillus sp.]|uniref:histidine phosphatase family protein n=1 Tax=uncultured Metabacillus sp. TaxID=2860135 RepID=UPI002616CD81|nr:histidine phosphatase family protein [uncultured Metabacillus sp.]
MTSICIIRHGETDWNAIGKLQGRTDIPLNETGVFQAEECAEFLKEFQWDVIVTSPLKRAKQTAEIIKRKIDVPLIEMEEFVEKGFGHAEGLMLEEREAAFPDGNYPNEETNLSITTRVMEGIQKINETFKDKRVLLVAHGVVITTILASLSNGEIDAAKTRLINACISNIYFQEEQWKIKDFNQITHLSKFLEV